MIASCGSRVLGAPVAPPTFADLSKDAEAARSAGDSSRAILLYGQALELRPDWAEGWWYLGVLDYDTNAYSAARDALTHYIALVPTAGPATALRGLCEFETQDFTSALKDIQQGLSHGAANRSRNEQILRYHEALLLTRKGDFEGALRSYVLVARSGPMTPAMLAGLGVAGLRKPLLPDDIHRSWDLVVRLRWRGEMNVRFQPYRLENSRCFDGTDPRISCIACHDPRKNVVHDPAFYDSKCIACHSPASKPIAAHRLSTRRPARFQNRTASAVTCLRSNFPGATITSPSPITRSALFRRANSTPISRTYS